MKQTKPAQAMELRSLSPVLGGLEAGMRGNVLILSSAMLVVLACSLHRQTVAPIADGEAGFSYVVGGASDFTGGHVVCVSGKDLDQERDLTHEIVSVLEAKLQRFENRCDATTNVIKVYYLSSYSACTHCPPPNLGPRFGSAQLTSERANMKPAIASWHDTRGGEADVVARRFGDALAAFLLAAGMTTSVE